MEEEGARMIHSEIQYDSPEGPVHSDLCPTACVPSGIDSEYRDFIHTALDEILDKLILGYTGAFYIGNQELLVETLDADWRWTDTTD
jgi:hypothetical protein